MQKPHAWKELPRTSAAGCHHRQPCPWVPHVVSSGPRLRPCWSLSVLARFYNITAWPIPGLGPRFVRDWNCVAFQFLQASQDQWQSLGCTWLYVVGIKQSLPTIGSIEGEADWGFWKGQQEYHYVSHVISWFLKEFYEQMHSCMIRLPWQQRQQQQQKKNIKRHIVSPPCQRNAQAEKKAENNNKRLNCLNMQNKMQYVYCLAIWQQATTNSPRPLELTLWGRGICFPAFSLRSSHP